MYIPNKQLKASSRVGLQITCLAWVHSILATKENPNNFPNLFILRWKVGAFENKVSRGRESVLSSCVLRLQNMFGGRKKRNRD